MWIVAIAWMYVALMMALAEATNPQGTVLGAIVTFLFYGVGPLALVMYLLGTPQRRARRRQAEQQTGAAQPQPEPSAAARVDSGATDGRSETPSAPVSSE